MSKLKIAGATFALVLAASTSAFAQTADAEAARKAETPSTEGVVTSAASCQYEGGFLGKVEGANVCMAPIRSEESIGDAGYNMQTYDGAGQGVFRCSGNGPFINEMSGPTYCRIFLEAKPRKKTRAELEAELAAMTEAELGSMNEVVADPTN